MTDPRLADTLLNEPQYIERLMQMPDSKLSKKLSIVRQQMETAFQNNHTIAFETLCHWERQIIEARYLKNDLEEAPAPKPAQKKPREEKETTALQATPEQEINSEPPLESSPAIPTQLVLFG